jgi:uncharacterized protein (TIGR02246 family)
VCGVGTGPTDRHGVVPTISEDRDEIRDLLSRYCLYFDEGSVAEWARLYCDDGEFIGPGQHLKGREAITALLADLPPSTVHRVTVNHVIDIDGDRARCRSSVLLLDGGVIVSSGRVVDELSRVDGAWRIARRTFTGDPVTSDR